jgi:predicted AAA+ superfamily ATPase
LGADCGISGVTAKQCERLESSHAVMLLKPHHRNFGKRLVKSPQLYFLDVGLAAWLMGIRDDTGLKAFARGALLKLGQWVSCTNIGQIGGESATLFLARQHGQ